MSKHSSRACGGNVAGMWSTLPDDDRPGANVMGASVMDATYDPAKVGRVIGNGYSKTVFEYGAEYVVKFANIKEPSHRDEILMEALLWETIKDDVEISALFAEVVAFDPDGQWLIMERADSLAEDIFDDVTNEYRSATMWDAYRAFARFVSSLGINDIGSNNVGVFDGTFKVIDYSFYGGADRNLSKYYTQRGIDHTYVGLNSLVELH
jgi:hypothetical protein